MGKIKLSAEQQQDLVCENFYKENGNYIEFEEVEKGTDGNWRHGTEEHIIVKRKSDGKFFRLNYRSPSNDYDVFIDVNYGGELYEVQKREKIMTVYEYRK